jgi:hypothetical protein
MGSKVELWLRVADSYLLRYYCVAVTNGAYSAGARSDLTRELTRLLGHLPDYASDPLAELRGARVIASVRLVTRDRHERELPPELTYSVCAEVIRCA